MVREDHLMVAGEKKSGEREVAKAIITDDDGPRSSSIARHATLMPGFPGHRWTDRKFIIKGS